MAALHYFWLHAPARRLNGYRTGENMQQKSYPENVQDVREIAEQITTQVELITHDVITDQDAGKITRAKQKEILDILTQEAQEMGMGY